MTVAKKSERKDFKKWAKEEGYLIMVDGKEVFHPHAGFLWEGWKARAERDSRQQQHGKQQKAGGF